MRYRYAVSTTVIVLRPEPYEVEAWDRVTGGNRNAWAVAVLDVAAGYQDHEGLPRPKRVRVPADQPLPTNSTSRQVSLRVTDKQRQAYEAAARRACMRRHAWIVQMLDAAAGLSGLPEQFDKLRSALD